MALNISFGTWRFLLAILVMITHLWASMLRGPAAYAVWGFFVLSGYLMTKVLREKYGFDSRGIIAYAYNRLIRIMPLYYLAVILGFVTILTIGVSQVDLTKYSRNFGVPQGQGWLFALTLLPFFPVTKTPVVGANALGIEVGAYLLMPLLAKSRSAAWVAMIIATYINWNYGLTTDSFAIRYATFLPCLFAFSAGSLIAHYRDVLAKYSMPFISIVVWFVHCLLWYKFHWWPWTYGIYVSVLLSAWVTISLDKKNTSRVDKLLGDLSYPIYLFHVIVAAWLVPYFGYDRTFLFFVVSFCALMVLSLLIVRFIDEPLHAFKKTGVLNQ